MPNGFPKGFLWGASTSAHQVEGNNHNQWSEWEIKNAQRLAHKAVEPRVATYADNYISGTGVEHYSRYSEDFQIIKSLNMNSFRFSIEWSRLQPEQGMWDQNEINHYHNYIDELNRQGITPVLTLWHWTMPVWFTNKGGFEQAANIRYFTEFTKRVAKEYASKVAYVITLNEPNSYTQLSYVTAEWPPQSQSLHTAYKVYRNLVTAHTSAYKVFKSVRAELPVGVAMILASTHEVSAIKVFSKPGVLIKDYIANWWFLDQIKGCQDFIGTNFYFSEYYNWRMKLTNPARPVSDYDWYMEPSALLNVLQQTHQRYGLPQIITENGLADATDQYRQWWLEETISAMQQALQKGVNLCGYLHWSLLDNFEWADGWWPKFGLVAVDRKTMKRSIRPSARWFAAYIAASRKQA